MKRALKFLVITVIALLGAAFAALVTVWEKPELVLRESGVRWALAHFAPAGFEVRWGSFAWSFRTEGWLTKGTRLAVRDLCFRYGKVAEGCAPEVTVDLSFTLAHLRAQILRVRALVLDVDHVAVRPSPGTEPAPVAALPDLRPPSFASLFPQAADPGNFGDVRVALRSFLLVPDRGDRLAASLALEKGAANTFSLTLEARQGGAWAASVRGEGAIENLAFAWRGTAKAEKPGTSASFPFRLVWGDAVQLRGSPSVRQGKRVFGTPLALNWGAEKITVNLDRLTFDELWPKKRILLQSCRFEAELAAGFPRGNQLRCRLRLESLGRGSILPPLESEVRAELALARDGKSNLRANLHVTEQGKNDYLESRLDLRATARFRAGLAGLVGTPDLEFSGNVAVPELQRWKVALDRTPLALPAPFRVLAGPARIDAQLERADSEELRLRVHLATDFRGGNQALVTRHDAVVRLAKPWTGPRALFVDANDELTEVTLEAPPLQLEAAPQFLPDQRIEATRPRSWRAKAPASALPVHWRAKLVTKAPVRIRTNLLEHEIPVGAKIALSGDQGLDGVIEIQPMRIAVFKKKVDVKKIALTFRPGSAVGDVNGTLVYRNPEITIRILLLGSTDKPRVEFESDPPLNRQQIVAVLLFNKSVAELNDEEAASAGSFSQATADGALGLFSLLFLSSTPVEALSYDPVSQTYSARVRVDKKTTLSVGSDFDRERQVGLRRRLGGRWAVRTELHDEQGRPDVLLTLLEWFKRF